MYANAEALVIASKQAGADAVKIQIFRPEDMTINSGNQVVKDGPWQGQTLWELYSKACFPTIWLGRLKEVAKQVGITLFPTVYSQWGLEVAERYEFPIYKISSFELNHLDLISEVAKTKKPIIMSAGMADYNEIDKAVKTVKRYHNNIAVLRCVSEYPAPIENMNLITMQAYERCFRVSSGLSDHTTGITCPVTATALGAKVIEKHITLDGEGLDVGFSITPDRFNVMVQAVRTAEQSIGRITYGGTKKFRRARVAIKEIKQGENLDSNNTNILRVVDDIGISELKIADKDYAEGENIGQRKGTEVTVSTG
jgi:sialic acid synthase SpsE